MTPIFYHVKLSHVKEWRMLWIRRPTYGEKYMDGASVLDWYTYTEQI